MADKTTGPEGPVSEAISSPQVPEPNTGPVAAIEGSAPAAAVPQSRAPQALAPRTPPPPPPPTPPPPDEEDEEEDGMLRMSFMDHLEELRTRILRALIGVVVAFVASLAFADPLWRIVSAPAVGALKHLGINPPNLAYLTPMEGFNVIYIKLPLLVSIFAGSPWILYQVWAFISPGLYRKEKRWAVPFILCTAGLFIAGGLFAYFVAFRYGLDFLLGLGRNINVTPVVSINEYFDLFVNVTLGIGLVFEMPVIIFFLTLLRMASPRFLLRHSRYAILAITIIAAIVTPTPDIFNMMLFAVPMVGLYFVGLLASYLLILKREGRKFPWGILVLSVLGIVALAAVIVAVMIFYYHYHFIQKWPFLVK
ncbi:MAG TPA: twin-arginine translocase subunit TatC [Bryobacteraceae bacterium]|jgi:sec-independent protein translocase protein TatC|nr:twin-arginine translocase subunit TatC [Bryobacteraceae bacterium]